MAKRPSAPKSQKKVETLRHPDDKRLNIPTAEHQSVLEAATLYLDLAGANNGNTGQFFVATTAALSGQITRTREVRRVRKATRARRSPG